MGDWSCKIWVEDLKVPIIRTKYHNAYLSDGCWSPSRNGAFFLTRRVLKRKNQQIFIKFLLLFFFKILIHFVTKKKIVLYRMVG